MTLRTPRKQALLSLCRKHPDWTAPKIAAALGVRTAYVRAAGARWGLTYARAHGTRTPRTAAELRAAAAILIAKAEKLEQRGQP